ncbi:phage terminase large subunit family protein [Terrihabitans rhizophilus]|uniref:Terminase gpA endonuclease subunit n=1 Tax=Terrihabitans rhizophilus TaxID=3092662 RepID=A0ABU4RRR7_9HYPH|nr:terminase gpA endonuclease subunit [Terrihabitans sp. PJ23]MDX6806325.1 terminase gpA endonuclease subunit [Terrihabitans sp. PJ23]
MRPPPKLNLIEWADEYRYVAKQNSANPGKWKTSRVPVAFGPMLAVTEPDTQTVTLMACTQLVKSEWLLTTALYFIHQDPSSILFVQPTQKLAESFSKERFAPTREVTPAIAALVPDPKSRDSGVTITHKEYPGGMLDFVGANSAVDLASRPKRITICDEIDLYPADASGMGPPLQLAEERSSTFKKRRKNLRACSPSDETSSIIWQEYLAGDQRKCFVICPHCQEEQTLVWSPQTVLWDKDADGNHLPETVRYHCRGCGIGWSEAERVHALRSLGEQPDKGWRQTKQFKCCGVEQSPTAWNDKGRSLCTDCGKPSMYGGHASFQVSKLYSTRHDLSAVVREWLGAHRSREKLRKFTNTALAEVWKEKVERLDPKALAERIEPYSAESVPAAVQLIVWGADTQDDRIEVTFQGWGADEECWVLKHEVLLGDTAKKQVWDTLDKLVKEPFLTEDGRRLVPQAGCIDSGGHRGEMVHAFCRARKSRRIYAIAGRGNGPEGSKLIWPKTPSRTKNSGDRLYIVGVDTAKDALASRLMIQPDDLGEPVPFAIHFPHEGLSSDYFEQLTSEKAVSVFQSGREFRKWFPKAEGIRNEALDCFVYGMAARLSLPNRLRAAGRQVKPVKAPEREPGEQITAENDAERVGAAPAAQPTRSKRSRASWGAYR